MLIKDRSLNEAGRDSINKDWKALFARYTNKYLKDQRKFPQLEERFSDRRKDLFIRNISER